MCTMRTVARHVIGALTSTLNWYLFHFTLSLMGGVRGSSLLSWQHDRCEADQRVCRPKLYFSDLKRPFSMIVRLIASVLVVLPACFLYHEVESSSRCAEVVREAAMSGNYLLLSSSALRSAGCLVSRANRTEALIPSAFMSRARNGGAKSTARSYSEHPAIPSAFTFRLAAASAGKRTAPRPPKFGQDHWSYSSAHEKPSPPYVRSTKPDSGEDAFFMTTVGGDKHHVAFGLADGVGGWQDQGVDPSDFSHGLCGLMAGTAYIHEGLEDGKLPKPRALMQTAYDAVIANPRIIAGGCTASLAVIDGDGHMEAAK